MYQEEFEIRRISSFTCSGDTGLALGTGHKTP